MPTSERVSQYRHSVSTLDTRVSLLREDVKRMKGRMAQIETEKTLNVKALGVLDRLIQTVSAQGIGRIEKVVSRGLKLVFGPDLSLEVDKKIGAKGTSYRLNVRHKDVVGNPMEMFGGGVVNVTAFLLRILMVKRFKLAKFLALDESFNNVSSEYLPKVSEMLQVLSQDHGYRILAVTHQPILAGSASRTYMVSVDHDLPRMELLDMDLRDQTV